MKPHPRIRKTIKWGGASSALVLAVVWLASGWWEWVFRLSTHFHVGIGDGCAFVMSTRARPNGSNPVNYFYADRNSFGAAFVDDFVLVHHYHLDWKGGHWKAGGLESLNCPLWPVVLALGTASLVAWRIDNLARRRARLNLCPSCGYNRAGLAPAAKCPECGMPNT